MRTPAQIGRASRTKGAKGENEFCKLLHAHGWTLARRRFGSGVYGGGDITDGPEGYSIEIKRTARRNSAEAWKQCCAGARPTDTPVVVWRENRRPWIAAIEPDELDALSFTADESMYVLIRQVQRLQFWKAWDEVSFKAPYDYIRVVRWESPDLSLSFLWAEDLLRLIKAREG